MFRVVGINGSPRKSGNTAFLISEFLHIVAEHGFETQMIHLAATRVAPCDGCNACKTTKRCHIRDDFDEVYAKLLQADGIVIGSPVYIGAPTGNIVSLMGRTVYLARQTGNPFDNRVGTAVVSARRGGANFVLAQLNLYLSLMGMIVPNSSVYWHIAITGGGKASSPHISSDEEGIATVRNLADKMTWLLQKIGQHSAD